MPTYQRTAIATILRQLSQGFLSREEAAKGIKETYFSKG
jgi:predicted PP-loop superfamily ATPase